MTAIDKAVFTGVCVRKAVFLGVNPHYLVAIAQLRSAIDDGSSGTLIGPYRLLQSQWDQFRTDAEFGYDYQSDQITSWIMQCSVFALMTYRAQTTLLNSLNRYPSTVELYNAQWPSNQTAVAELQTALDTTAPFIEPAANALLEQPWLPSPVNDGTDKPIPEPTSPSHGPDASPHPTDPSLPGGPLGELISRGEGNYNSFNRGTTGSSGSTDFTQVTIASIMHQQALPQGDPQRLFAVGKYQLIPSTMKSAIASLELNPQSALTHSIQEQLFREYLIAIKRPAVKSFITGGGASLDQAQMSLALEFASVARPDTGLSNYGGVGGNKASITAAETANRLQQEQTHFQQMTTGGMKAVDAWIALSPGIGQGSDA